ncbi:MAG: glucose-1-phosphate cytidylyltransferase [Chlamydiae bacterium]|nr:glucose-1-phosphate cytidylyltransferase [Chlamydiota bacterium]
MKVIILAGGFGTRLSEKTAQLPKSLVEIGGKPILWHIMHHYSLYGFSEFVIALGFLGEMIKSYFLNYYALHHDLTIDLGKNQTKIHEKTMPDWKIHLIDTGLHTQTGGRLKRLKEWIGSEAFLMTYGDGLSNVNLTQLVAFHKSHKKLATVTAVHPPPRFGGLTLEEEKVVFFSEKPQKDWINGGFFVLEPEVLGFIKDDMAMWEKEPLETLAQQGELVAFKHSGFWHPMDTLRDHRTLEALWSKQQAPWTEKNALLER